MTNRAPLLLIVTGAPASGKTTVARRLAAELGCPTSVQVVCTAPTDVLIDRYVRRAESGERHPGHADIASFDEILPRIATERWDAMPLGGTVFCVDTSGQVDIGALVVSIRAELMRL